MTETTETLSLAETLVRLSQVVQHVFAEVSREHGLTPQQAQLLCRLVPGPVRMADLARMLNLEKSSVTGLVDRVENRGLVTRAQDANDRRACQVTLTPLGIKLALHSHSNVMSRLDLLVNGLPSADTDQMASVLASILAQYSASTGHRM
ncbi:MAG: MarR family winged helix-turn-helix transcriptional regulator [Pseudonocardiaceae bacterium]